MTVLLLISISVCLEVAGQVFYKAGMNHAAAVPGSLLDAANLLAFAGHALTNWRILAGLGVYAAQVLVWWIILTKADVSYAFPLTSLSYVLVLAVASVFMHERVGWQRWLGAVTVMAGVFLITRSAPTAR